jgi:hypothetical protein
MNLPTQPSESLRKRNPHIYGINHQPNTINQAKRLRQSSAPRLNKLEAEFGARLRMLRPDDFITEQAITFRLGNGVRFTPDVVKFSTFAGFICAYEVKGEWRKDSRWATDDSRVKIKVAAAQYPFIAWYLVWKEKGEWLEQKILA